MTPYISAEEETSRAEERRLSSLLPRIFDLFDLYRRVGTDAQAVQAMRTERLARMLRHALSEVPFYRRFADLATTVDDDPHLALRALPTRTKRELAAGLRSHCADKLSKETDFAVRTSGTTGIPFRFVIDAEHLAHTIAQGLAHQEPAVRGGAFHLRKLELYDRRHDGWFEYTSAAKGLARVASLSLRGLASDREHRAAGFVWRFAPDMIFCHPSQACELIGHCTEHGLPLPAPSVVYTSGEQLDARDRARIESAFGAPVRDTYGMREVGAIAHECPSGRYHVMDERLCVEILDPGGDEPVPDGTAGEIVVTHLINRAMPFLRYRTGDLGMITAADRLPCDCGRASSTLTLTEGRKNWAITFPGGESVSVLTASRAVRGFPVERFQILQQAADIEVLVKWLPEATGADTAALRSSLTELFGDTGARVRCTTAADQDFVRSPSGKQSEFLAGVSR
ncbi:phenylacetate-CoA ligase [Amycolatopsis xylanica]|uniref:Phenylacetate-CoA ligase n=1 Tax=Amycolatopsis xylanica TaxID=589385 RepID=A0A1H3PKV6_9PSEU|nr:AMP-binding protein [Amycolatopsis xylanica]SDZ01691.1 phenylacetate-CoA ligase [Amycolatopsis xylanica]